MILKCMRNSEMDLSGSVRERERGDESGFI
jgi:hypothetical protein